MSEENHGVVMFVCDVSCDMCFDMCCDMRCDMSCDMCCDMCCDMSCDSIETAESSRDARVDTNVISR